MQNNLRPDAKILVVDDEDANLALLRGILKKGHYENVQTLHDSRRFNEVYDELQPDLILLDLHMPHVDGFQILESLYEKIGPTSYVPVLVLTADATPKAKEKALSMGAKDFLVKPLDPVEALLRVNNLMDTRLLHMQMQERNRVLSSELDSARVEVAHRLARAAERRDDDTGEHIIRVGQLSGAVARELGFDSRSSNLIEQAAPLHDVGKIGIPDSILLKQGPLTAEERTEMQTHTIIGAGILGGSRLPLLQIAEKIALAHHERWDGGGYPYGLAGKEIPMAGRIVAVVDVFDALTHERPYKAAWPIEEALEEIERQADMQFDSRVVRAFLSVIAAQTAAPGA